MIWLLRVAETVVTHQLGRLPGHEGSQSHSHTTPFPDATPQHVAVDEPEDLRKHDPHYGMTPWVYALIFGIVSGLSLPIASVLGIYLSPVSSRACGLMMAFGAGALLFAVTVELYGHALHEVAAGNLGLAEMFTTIFGALVGAAFYLTINQWLEEWLEQDEKPEARDSPREDVEAQPKDSSAASAGSATSSLASITASAALKGRGKELWGKVRAKRGIIQLIHSSKPEATRARDIAMFRMAVEDELHAEHLGEKKEDEKHTQHAKSVAFALFLGLLVDGVPEGVLMGFLAAEGHLTPVLIVSLFIANFPEAFSSSSLLIQARMSTSKIIGMWVFLCLLVGSLCGASCYFLLLNFPTYGSGSHGDNSELPGHVLLGIALVEGITGGAMIACISSVMLPEAFEQASAGGKAGAFYTKSGFFCVGGFLLSVAMKALFG